MADDSGSSSKINPVTLVLLAGVILLGLMEFSSNRNVHALEAKLNAIQSDQAKAREQIQAWIGPPRRKPRRARRRWT